MIASLGKHLDNIIGIHFEAFLQPWYQDIKLYEDIVELLMYSGFSFSMELYNYQNQFGDYLYLREDTTKQEKLQVIRELYGCTEV